MYVLFVLRIFHFETETALSITGVFWLQEKRFTLKPEDLNKYVQVT